VENLETQHLVEEVKAKARVFVESLKAQITTEHDERHVWDETASRSRKDRFIGPSAGCSICGATKKP
jgi:hypothetical protein